MNITCVKQKRTIRECAEQLLAKLDSLGVGNDLTIESYEWIVAAGFRNGNDVLAALIASKLLDANPVTLRGLFYIVVSSGLLDSTSEENYRRIGRLVTRLRRTRIIKYSWIVDSLRSTDKPSSWSGLSSFAETVRNAYRKDFWEHLEDYVHVFTEKDAIAGVIQPVTREYDVALSPIRGYASESFVWGIAEQWKQIKKPIHAAYLGDYDPSGFDIERDLREKLSDLSGRQFEWVRIGVNSEDFDAFDLVKLKPKKSDKRFKKFSESHGGHCAEIDAIPPEELRGRVRQFIEYRIPTEEWERLKQTETIERESFNEVMKAFE